jgi:hypothetical protein
MISFPKHGISIEHRVFEARESLGLENEYKVALYGGGGEVAGGHKRLDVRGRKYSTSHGNTTSVRAARD